MVKIKSTSNIVSIGKKNSIGRGSSSKSSEETQSASPFAAQPADALKSLTERKSRPLTEEQKLALLQGALKPFAAEARSHLPQSLSDFEKKVRREMIKEGFSEALASEAGDEAVTVLMTSKVPRKKSV